MPSERGLDRDFRGFGIANFTDHHDVRVLTENGAKGIAEAQTDLLADRYLVDARDLEFDGVFDGYDVVLGIVQLIESGVERRGFSRAGGTSDEEQPVRCIDCGAEPAIGVGLQAQFVHARGKVRFVQNTEHAFFAVDGGEERNTKVKVTPGDLHAHASVLRQAPLGDVEAAHDLKTRDQGHLKITRWWRFIDQDAVNAVAQPNHIFKRFDVNITGALFDSLDQNEVGQFDDRRFFNRSGE